MRRIIFVLITALIIFSSCKLKDDTSSSIVEPTTTEATITVLAPNGGETWIVGLADTLRWNSVGVKNVKIEYTINGGATWNVITNSIQSTGSYIWPNIPDVNNSLQCRIKISDAAYGTPSDISDGNFAIMSPGVQKIKVTSPNGGEKLPLGSSQNITWDAGGIANVKIEYTINNGNSWNTLIASTPSNGFYTWSQIPNTLSTNCKVRISDAQDGSPSDDSDQFFSVVPPDIEVVSPNGGETIQSGTNSEIRWTSVNVENVKIEYTINGGAVWNTIINTTPSFGTYIWANVPNANSLQCRIRVSDAHNGTPFDISDQNFQITNLVVKSVKLISPNGGEDWEAGTSQIITWNSSGVNNIKIELSTNKGANWSVLAENYTGGAYEWAINESLNSTQCQIRLSDATDNTVSDISDAVFIISPKKFIIVTGPVTKIYKSNEPVTITWNSGGIKSVGIKYTTTNGIADPNNPAFTPLAIVGAASGSYTTYFSLPSDKYFVVVYNADEGSNGMPSNNSPGFTVEKAMIPAVIVLTPNGGEQWLGNEPNVDVNDFQKYHPFEIKWRAENTTKVKIEWTTNGGGNWYVVPGADSTANDGIFVWAPGRLDNPVRPDSSDNCRVRISSVDKGGIEISDMTDDFFSIHKSKKIRVEYPNDGQDFYPPDDLTDPKPSEKWPMLISWTSYAIQNVNIYYSLDNGETWATLATNYQSTGAFSWDFIFGTVIEPKVSTLGRIKIVDASDGTVWDVNDIPFWLNVKKISGAIVPDLKLEKIEKKK